MTWARKPGPLSGEEITTSFNNTGMGTFQHSAPGPAGRVVDVSNFCTRTIFSVDEHQPTPNNGSRELRCGEIMLIAKMFGQSIDSSKVRIYRRKYFPLQPDNVTMAPNGNIYFNTGDFSEDFSLEHDDNKKAHFIHEMVHVWQSQLGYPVMLRGAIRVGLPYEYDLHPTKRLKDYNMEAQGDIISDYYLLKHINKPHLMKMREKYGSPSFIPLYEQVLSDFLFNPSSQNNLPDQGKDNQDLWKG